MKATAPPGYVFRVGEIKGAAAGGRVPVRIDGQTVRLHLIRSYAPTLGDEVLVVLRRGQGYVVGALGTGPPAPRPEEETGGTAPDSSAPSGSTLFRPVQVDTYRAGVGWLGVGELIQGDQSKRGLNTGAAFYGDGPRGLRGVAATGVFLTLERLPGGWPQRHPTVWLVTQKTRPAGAPTRTLSWFPPLTPAWSISAGQTQTYQLPTDWGTELIAGTAGGIAVHVTSDPDGFNYARFLGSRAVLRVDWRR